MQSENKKWPMEELQKNEATVPPYQTPAPTPQATRPAEVFKTPTPEEEKKILEFARFIDDFQDFKTADKVQLKTLLASAYHFIPRKTDIQKKEKELVHHIPVEIKLAGEFIGRLVEKVRGDAALTKEAFHFFNKCSKDENFPTTIRALCLSHSIRSAEAIGQKVDLKGIPPRLIELSKLTLELEE